MILRRNNASRRSLIVGHSTYEHHHFHPILPHQPPIQHAKITIHKKETTGDTGL